ncbi:hypothetical protein EVAR_53034_1 [Eumeta japonica]|uniref:Uncharacterized protein n=1 Tax=Eumeta variegata TaxID=151549 RepID=A0A4C1XQQ4_EUMVA|nr:hypothetical protein EVAR_53034_1 [Eumeta japonica]
MRASKRVILVSYMAQADNVWQVHRTSARRHAVNDRAHGFRGLEKNRICDGGGSEKIGDLIEGRVGSLELSLAGRNTTAVIFYFTCETVWFIISNKKFAAKPYTVTGNYGTLHCACLTYLAGLYLIKIKPFILCLEENVNPSIAEVVNTLVSRVLHCARAKGWRVQVTQYKAKRDVC